MLQHLKDNLNKDKFPSLFFFLIFNSGTLSAAPLNDTGITQCGNAGSNTMACPQTDYPGQDAQYGRDVDNNDNSDGHAGFSFTKLDANGNVLEASATTWSCVKDNTTGLIWEVKTDDGGLRDKDWTYTWYNSTGINDGGVPGTANGGACLDTVNCDTEKFVQQVNAQGLCGATSDWRLPTKNELGGLVSFNRFNPGIDVDYFTNTRSSRYWSASSYYSGSSSSGAWYVSFDNALSGGNGKSTSLYVRLLRMGQ